MQQPRTGRPTVQSVKRLLHLLVGLLLALGAIGAQAQRSFNQAELDALLAPIALYPDPLLTHILNASVYPQDVFTAAAWSRANPQLQGDAALATVQGEIWHPSVKALVAYPDVLARLAESPQWLSDLGEAYTGLPQYVDATVQQLRSRAAASGYLRSNEQQYVYQQGETIVVQPAYTNVVYAPYYDPFVVYGTWWWPAYRPVYFRPWVARPVFVTRIIQPVRIVQPVRVVQPVRIVHPPHRVVEHPRFVERQVQVTPYRPVPESRRMPIVQSAPAVRSLPPSQSPRHLLSAPVERVRAMASAPAYQMRSTPPAEHARPAQSSGHQGGGRSHGGHGRD